MSKSSSPSQQESGATTVASGFLTLLGLPNAGKSTLFNAMVGQRLAIVSPKAQTTRSLTRGFVVREGLRLIVVDTPGVQTGTKALNQALSGNVSEALIHRQSELVAIVLDAREIADRMTEGKHQRLNQLVDGLKETFHGKTPLPLSAFFVFNKADLVKDPQQREQVELFAAQELKGFFKKWYRSFWIHGRDHQGIEAILGFVKGVLPETSRGLSDDEFDEEAVSDQPLKEFVSEYIREQCFTQLGEELPYSIAVEINRFDESRPELPRIEATIHVERESQKGMVVGQGGRRIRSIGSAARERVEELMQTHVYLGLRVKVSPHWSRDQHKVEGFGYGKTH